MGKLTEISWTDHTFNCWWGCFKVSAGCTHCYADTLATRWGHKIWGPPATTARRLFGPKHWQEPVLWDHEAEAQGVRKRVFCASMADVFEDHPMLVNERYKLWDLIAGTPHLDWLLLTKRPENIPLMMPWKVTGWPNVWLGTSTEDQEQADKRIPLLLKARNQVPVLFLSVEPQLGPISLDVWLGLASWRGSTQRVNRSVVDWVITGGESGPGHRPFDEDWARLTRDQCRAAGVAWHYKQFGGMHHADGGCLLDGREHKAFPVIREPVHA